MKFHPQIPFQVTPAAGGLGLEFKCPLYFRITYLLLNSMEGTVESNSQLFSGHV